MSRPTPSPTSEQVPYRVLMAREKVARHFSTLDGPEAFTAALDAVLECLDSTWGRLAYIDDAGALVMASFDEAIYERCSMVDPSATLAPARWGGLWGRALRERRTLVANSGLQVPEGHIPLSRSIATPVLHGGELIGLLNVADRASDYTDADAALLETLADAIAPVLAARLQRDRARREREQVEAALRESEERYRTFFETARDGIGVADAETGVILECNEALLHLLDRPRADVIGQHQRAMHPPEETMPTGRTRTLDLHASAASGEALEAEIVTPSGERRPVEIRASRELVMGREVLLGVFRDLRHLKREQARLAEASRLASVGLLAAGVSHEINNPLTWVLRQLVALRDELAGELGAGPDSPDRRRLAGRVASALEGAERVKDVASHMAALAGTEDEALVPVHLHRVARAGLTLTRNQLAPRAIVVEALEEVPAALANEGRLVLVVVSLLLNAADSMDPDAVDPGRIAIRTSFDADVVTLEVQDSGCGIPADRVRRIFDPYYTTKDHSPGAGLGLALCQGVIGSLGGRIEVESQVGAGSLFRVCIPRASVAERPAPGPVSLPTGHGRRRVLVVDDEPMILAVLTEIVSAHHDVAAARSVDEALERLSEPFDAILCDLTMPGRSGIDLYDWLVAHQPRMAPRIVFMSGGVFTPAARDFLDGPGEGWLRKPFDEEDVLAALARVSGKRDEEPAP